MPLLLQSELMAFLTAVALQVWAHSVIQWYFWLQQACKTLPAPFLSKFLFQNWQSVSISDLGKSRKKKKSYFLTYFLFQIDLIWIICKVESSGVNCQLLSVQLQISRTLIIWFLYSIRFKTMSFFSMFCLRVLWVQKGYVDY